MNKKVGMIMGAIILVLIAGIFIFKGMSKPEATEEVGKQYPLFPFQRAPYKALLNTQP